MTGQRPPQAAVAQWIEYRPPKPRVVGSIPASRATPHTVLASKTFTKRQPTGLALLFLVLCWSLVGRACYGLKEVGKRVESGVASGMGSYGIRLNGVTRGRR